MYGSVRRLQYLRLRDEEQMKASHPSSGLDVYDETVKVINEMVNNLRLLLTQTRSFLERTINFQSTDSISDMETNCDNFKKFMSGLPLSLGHNVTLDQTMARPFFMRVTRQIMMWRGWSPQLSGVIEKIESRLQEEKRRVGLNIELIYRISMTIIIECNQRSVQAQRQRLLTLKEQENQEQAVHTIFNVPIFSNVINKDSQQAKKQFDERCNLAAILFQGMEAVTICSRKEEVNGWHFDGQKPQSIELMQKRQLKRNKRCKMQIKEYKNIYSEYLIRRKTKYQVAKNRSVSNQAQMKLSIGPPKVRFARTNSNSKDSSSKNQFLPELDRRNMNHSQQFPVNKNRKSQSEHLSRNKENKNNGLAQKRTKSQLKQAGKLKTLIPKQSHKLKLQ